jgi:hypothetical protein
MESATANYSQLIEPGGKQIELQPSYGTHDDEFEKATGYSWDMVMVFDGSQSEKRAFGDKQEPVDFELNMSVYAGAATRFVELPPFLPYDPSFLLSISFFFPSFFPYHPSFHTTLPSLNIILPSFRPSFLP